MPNPTITTTYAGEVLDEILTQTATGNELFENGLVRVIPGVRSSVNIPRLSLSKLLQKRKSSPNSTNSKGVIKFADLQIIPQDVMVYTEFNPREYENYWKQYQPTGNLIFAELPDNVKTKLVEQILAQVATELGEHILVGVKGEVEDKYFDGFVTRILASSEKVVATTTETSMIKRLQAVWDATGAKTRRNKNFTFLVSASDADAYGEELAALPNKGTDPAAADNPFFKAKRVVGLNDMPDGLIVATICALDNSSNLVVACSMVDDAEAVQVEKVSAASENFFIKLLMKYDTGVVFENLCTVLDIRTLSLSEPLNSPSPLSASAMPEYTVKGGTKTCTVNAATNVEFTTTDEWVTLTAGVSDDKISVSVAANSTGAAREGSITITSQNESIDVAITQAAE